MARCRFRSPLQKGRTAKSGVEGRFRPYGFKAAACCLSSRPQAQAVANCHLLNKVIRFMANGWYLHPRIVLARIEIEPPSSPPLQSSYRRSISSMVSTLEPPVVSESRSMFRDNSVLASSPRLNENTASDLGASWMTQPISLVQAVTRLLHGNVTSKRTAQTAISLSAQSVTTCSFWQVCYTSVPLVQSQ